MKNESYISLLDVKELNAIVEYVKIIGFGNKIIKKLRHLEHMRSNDLR